MIVIIVTSLLKSWDLLLWRKCPDSSQLLIIWFLWLSRRRLKAVSLLPPYCSLQIRHSITSITKVEWQLTVWKMSNTLSGRCVPVKIEVLFIGTHQLYFGLLHGPQLPIVVVCLSGVLPVNLVLTSMSRRPFEQLYAIIGLSLNMWASLSFDWRKCQFLFATSAIYEVRGLYVVTKGMRLMVCLYLACKLLSCVSDRTLRISDSVLSLL